MGQAGTQEKYSSENYILAEFKITEEILEEEQIIYNAINNVVHNDENEEDVNREVRYCDIQINGEAIDFVQDYQFEKAGIYTIKYTFKNPLVDASSLFFYCPRLIKIDLSHFQGQKLKIVREMFGGGCELLQSINLSNLELPNVTDMRAMFSSCYSLKAIDLSNLKANKVEKISGLFSGCVSLESVNLSNFNTENVTDMSSLFYSCKSLKEIDLSNFNTQNVKNMKSMFDSCDNLVKVNLSNFNITTETDLLHMFYMCKKLKKEGIITKEKKIFEQYEKGLNKGD